MIIGRSKTHLRSGYHFLIRIIMLPALNIIHIIKSLLINSKIILLPLMGPEPGMWAMEVGVLLKEVVLNQKLAHLKSSNSMMPKIPTISGLLPSKKKSNHTQSTTPQSISTVNQMENPTKMTSPN